MLRNVGLKKYEDFEEKKRKEKVVLMAVDSFMTPALLTLLSALFQ